MKSQKGGSEIAANGDNPSDQRRAHRRAATVGDLAANYCGGVAKSANLRHATVKDASILVDDTGDLPPGTVVPGHSQPDLVRGAVSKPGSRDFSDVFLSYTTREPDRRARGAGESATGK